MGVLGAYLLTKGSVLIVIMRGNFSLDDHHQFAALKQNLRSNEFKNNYEVKTVVTRRLVPRTAVNRERNS
jgi:hypothetical protein